MRGPQLLLGTLFVVTGCGRTADTSPATPLDGGVADADTSTVDASTSDGGEPAPLCFAPPNGWVEQKITPGAHNLGFFGALDGDDSRIAAVGTAPDATATFGKSAVYLYRRAGDAWEPDGVVSEPTSGEVFGSSIAVDGATVAVGAPYADSEAGAVYVYVTESGVVRLEQRISHPYPPASRAGFGNAVALRGDMLAIGAYADSTSAAAGGRVYVYERAVDTWTLTSEIVSSDIADNDAFGAQIEFDGTRLAVYALRPRSGYSDELVYVFAYGATGWQEQTRLTPRDASSADHDVVGEMALDGDNLLVRTLLGRVLAYGRSAAGWALEQDLSADGALDGSASVDVRGTVAAIGTSEAAAIYDKSTLGWQLRETLHAGDEPQPRGYGTDVTLGTDSVAVLAPKDDDWGAGSGAIYAYVANSAASYAETCIDESTTSGPGTACTRSGATAAVCKYLPSNAGSLHGTTPAGPLDLPYAWVDVWNGFTSGARINFGASTPRRLDALPSVSVSLYPEAIASDSAPLVMQGEATLDVCGATLTIPVTVTLTAGQIDFGGAWTPIAGTLVIDSPGWNVTGSFAFDAVCQSWVST